MRLLLALSLLVAAVLSAVIATASGGAAPDRTPHVFVVPATPDGAAALDSSGARVLAHYESFTLAEAAGDSAGRLRRAGADRRDDLTAVRLGGRAVDPRSDRVPLGGKGGARADRLAAGGDGLAVVQFVGPVKDAWLGRLKDTGARVVTYMAQDAYLVHGNGPALARVAGLQDSDPAVRAITRYVGADKLPDAVPQGGPARLAMQTLSGPAGDAARRAIDAAGTELRPPTAVGPYRTQYTLVDAGFARSLAGDSGVLAVLPYEQPELRDERAAQIVAGNLIGSVPSGPGYLDWLDAQGFPSSTFDFAVDFTDEGLDKGVLPPPAGSHPDFYEDGSNANPTRIAYQSDYTRDPDARDCGGHGTNVASIATGYNDQPGTLNTTNDSSGFNYGQGIAPRAKLGASKIFRCTTGAFDVSGTLTALTSSAYANGARVSSNSWGADTAGAYDSDSQEYDALVRDARPTVAGNQEMVEVFAAGNAGPDVSTVGSPGTAKNVIAVGASENVRPIGASDGCAVPDSGANDARDLIDFSARGPTADGRLKPDVVAPGTHVSGASPQVGSSYNGSGTCNQAFPAGNTFYSLVSGTSQATPEVSGAAALVRDWYQRTVGGGTTPPSPAMTKAILVNTATDQAGGQDGKGGVNAAVPSNDQGWGRVNLGTVLDSTSRFYRDQADVLAASGDTVTRTFAVDASAKPFKVTVAWTDPPGPTTGNAFVNDLDLVVVADGQTYKGNVFAGGVSIPGGNADPRNNLESVYLPAGVSGPVSVTVRGTNIAGNGLPGNPDATDQDFALVVSNGTDAPGVPVLAHDLTTIDDAAGGDGDGVAEPGESVGVAERVRNFGTGPATGVSGLLSTSTTGVAVTQPDSGYPSVPAGSTATNSTPFGVDIADTVPCGATVDLALQLTTAQGNVSFPIEVPTGAAGPAVVRNSTDVPKAIADQGTAQSTLTVATPGIVKDVKVRITSIQHTADGDLRISLIGPDSTTVVLSDRHGGSGNNYTNTVFSDAAATAIASGSPPFTGTFRPDAKLDAFDDKPQQGTWTLRVEDLAAVDSGTLQSWGTDISRAECANPDTQPPDTSIDSGPSGPTNDSTPTFQFSSSEANSTFECRVDAAAFATCSSPFTTASLADGAHTFQVRATDPSSNVDQTPASRGFTVDTAPPQTSFTGVPPNPTNDPTPTFGFQSSEAGSSFQCRFDAAAFAACSTPFTPVAALVDGQHTFNVRATDSAGNTDPSPASQTFTVDTTAPDTTINSGPSGPTSDATPTFTFSSGDAGASFECRVVPAAFATCSSPFTTATLADGAHTFEVRAKDTAANTDPSPASQSFTVDTVAPAVTLVAPAAGSAGNDPTPTFSGAAGVAAGDAATVTIRVFAGASASGSPLQSQTVPVSAGAWTADASPALPDGIYTARAEQGDGAGNTGLSGTRTFTVDTTAPDTAINSGPAGPTNDATPTFTFSSGDAGASFECRVVPAAFATCSSPFTTATLADGAHTFEVRAKDAAANTDLSPASQSFTVDTAPPALTLTSPAAGSAGNDSTPTFSGAAGVAAGDAATVTIRVFPGTSAAGSPLQSQTVPVSAGAWTADASPALPDGIYTARAEQGDGAGNTGVSGTRTFTVDTTAPDTTIDSGPPGTTSDTTVAFTFSSADPGAHFECSLDSAPFAACTSPRTIGPLASGAHTFAALAIDTVGNDDPTPASRSFTITQATTPPPGGTPPDGSPGTPVTPSLPAGSLTPPGPGATPDTTAPALKILTRRALVRRGKTAIKLRCPASEPGGCIGTLVLRSGRTVLGRRSFRIAGGSTVKVTIRLRRAGAALFTTHRTRRERASASVHDLAGNRRTVRRSVLIRA